MQDAGARCVWPACTWSLGAGAAAGRRARLCALEPGWWRCQMTANTCTFLKFGFVPIISTMTPSRKHISPRKRAHLGACVLVLLQGAAARCRPNVSGRVCFGAWVLVPLQGVADVYGSARFGVWVHTCYAEDTYLSSYSNMPSEAIRVWQFWAYTGPLSFRLGCGASASDGLQPRRDGLQPTSEGLQPRREWTPTY